MLPKDFLLILAREFVLVEQSLGLLGGGAFGDRDQFVARRHDGADATWYAGLVYFIGFNRSLLAHGLFGLQNRSALVTRSALAGKSNDQDACRE